MVRQENLSVSPPEQALSPIEVDQQAFELIRQFKDAFKSRKPKYSSRKPDRITWGMDLSIGKVRYRALHGFFTELQDIRSLQSLQIVKDVQGDSPQDVVTDRLRLLSRRLQDQQFNPSADITFHGNILKHPVNPILRFNDLYRAVPPQEQEYEYVNTPSALHKARQMLAELSLQAP